jgi:phosphoribosylformimino-5-aminoimidazole carboxamide ribotide isomerase
MMELWAAIDLMDGSVVTLVQGRASDKTVWKEEPRHLAERWQTEGADGLHLIDLDAAFDSGSNRETILNIIEGSKIPVQVGGGVRSEEAARGWLENGARRVVIGTMAYSQPSVLARLLELYGPERMVVAADYRDGEIVTKGWKEGQGISLETAAKNFERAGVTTLLATAVGRDGMGSGPDIETMRKLIHATGLSIVASGGIRDVRDLIQLEEAGAAGAVIGKALYEETLRLPEAKRSLAR